MELRSLYCAFAVGLRLKPLLQQQQSSLDEDAERHETVEMLRSCLGLLPAGDREVLVSYYGIDCTPSTHVAIAQRMGISREAVRKRRLKALRLLREILVARGIEAPMI